VAAALALLVRGGGGSGDDRRQIVPAQAMLGEQLDEPIARGLGFLGIGRASSRRFDVRDRFPLHL
jgi:hypothetical protein